MTAENHAVYYAFLDNDYARVERLLNQPFYKKKPDILEVLKVILKEARSWAGAHSYPVGKEYHQYKSVRKIGQMLHNKGGMKKLNMAYDYIRSDDPDLYTYLDLLWNHLEDENGNELWAM